MVFMTPQPTEVRANGQLLYTIFYETVPHSHLIFTDGQIIGLREAEKDYNPKPFALFKAKKAIEILKGLNKEDGNREARTKRLDQIRWLNWRIEQMEEEETISMRKLVILTIATIALLIFFSLVGKAIKKNLS